MLEARIDLSKNRLYITLGRLRKDMVPDAEDTVTQVAAKLKPGFTCITRIVDFREVDEIDINQIHRIQAFLVDRGMAKAVRIGVHTAKDLFEEISRKIGYTADTANSMEEAEQLLDEWEAGQGG